MRSLELFALLALLGLATAYPRRQRDVEDYEQLDYMGQYGKGPEFSIGEQFELKDEREELFREILEDDPDYRADESQDPFAEPKKKIKFTLDEEVEFMEPWQEGKGDPYSRDPFPDFEPKKKITLDEEVEFMEPWQEGKGDPYSTDPFPDLKPKKKVLLDDSQEDEDIVNFTFHF